MKRFWETLSSIEMAVTLFALIIAAALAGTFTSYDVYHASWFAGLLTVFGVNLSACIANRIATRKVKVGSLVAHLGILVILSGVTVSVLFSERGKIFFSEGETSATASMPFKIRLDDFNVEWKDRTQHGIEARDHNIVLTYKFGSAPDNFKSVVTILDGGKERLTGTIEVNHPLKYRGYSFYQSSYDPARPQWTGLEVVRDPGVNVVFLGIVLLNLGVIIAFYRRRVGS